MIVQNKKKESEILILLKVMVKIPLASRRSIDLRVLCEETLNFKDRTKKYKGR